MERPIICGLNHMLIILIKKGLTINQILVFLYPIKEKNKKVFGILSNSLVLIGKHSSVPLLISEGRK